MSDPLKRAMAAVRADADAVVLAAPGAVRRVGTRRTRIKALSAALAALVVITGVSIGANQYFQSSAAPMPPGATSTPSGSPEYAVIISPEPSVEPSGEPSQTPPAGVSSEACATDPAKCYPPGVFYYEERLPAPCTTMQHPSNANITARQSVVGMTYFFRNEGATAYGKTMTRYNDAGARQYMSELRSALSRCSSVQRRLNDQMTTMTSIRYAIASRNTLGGDESLLLRRTYRTEKIPEQAPTDETFLIAVIRFGDVVLVIFDYGWEGSASPRATFDGFLAESVAEARAWRP
jgi:hypothetical protein